MSLPPTHCGGGLGHLHPGPARPWVPPPSCAEQGCRRETQPGQVTQEGAAGPAWEEAEARPGWSGSLFCAANPGVCAAVAVGVRGRGE